MAETAANKYIEKLNDINRIKNCETRDPIDIVAGIPINAAQKIGEQLPKPETELSETQKYTLSFIILFITFPIWLPILIVVVLIYIFGLPFYNWFNRSKHPSIRNLINTYQNDASQGSLIDATSIAVNAAMGLTDKSSNKVYLDFWVIWTLLFILSVFYNTYYTNPQTSVISNVILGWFLLLLLYQSFIPNKRFTFILYDVFKFIIEFTKPDTPATPATPSAIPATPTATPP